MKRDSALDGEWYLIQRAKPEGEEPIEIQIDGPMCDAEIPALTDPAEWFTADPWPFVAYETKPGHRFIAIKRIGADDET